MTFEEAMLEALNSPRYFYLTGRFDETVEAIANIGRRAMEFFFGLFDVDISGFGDGVDLSVLSGVFIGLSVVIVALILIFAARMVLRYRRKKSTESEGIFEDFRNNKLSLKELFELAVKYDGENNLKEAARYRYIALIMLFSQKEIVTVTDAMTGSQFEREVVKNAPALQAGVRETINMYYNLFFGHKSVDAEAYESYLAAYQEVIKEADVL